MHADPDLSLSEHLAYLDYQRRLQDCLGALSRPGWQKRLAPLAQHMARQRLVRACGYAGAFQRHLDLEVLCQALGRLLRHQWEDGYLIYQLVVENMDPAAVAAECGTSPLMLTELLRDAVDALAVEYEDVATMSLDPRRTPGVRPGVQPLAPAPGARPPGCGYS
jgi:hypothetical protein